MGTPKVLLRGFAEKRKKIQDVPDFTIADSVIHRAYLEVRKELDERTAKSTQ